MSPLIAWIFSVVAAVMLFLHGLAAFTEEVARLGGERLRDALRRLTRNDLSAALTGTLTTALVQSSSAITSMAVALAHNRTLEARAALGVMIGANIGTTLTAWLVALKIAGLGPVFVSLGGLWSLAGPRPWRPYGKAVFYFGLVFLALDLIGQALAPVAQRAELNHWQTLLGSPAVALVFGAVLTAVVQSSSVVTGMAVLTVQQTLLAPEVAIWLVAGANLGTSSTALLTGTALDARSRRLALLNSGFNVLGVLLFATVLQPLITQVLATAMPAARQVALVHTLFNLAAAFAALPMLPYLWPRLNRWLQRGEPG